MTTLAMPPFTLESQDLSRYLAHDCIVDWHSDAILSQSYAVAKSHTGEIDKARALYEWVRDTIPHTNDAGREEVTCRASDVLAAGTGICYAKSHLLAAMLRAAGIPAGFCYQTYYEPLHVSEDKIALHGLNAVYISPLGKWVRVDCRGNANGACAEFDTESERLAFPELQFLNNVIYAAPLKSVVAALQAWPTRTTLWPNLPKPLVESSS